MIFFTRELYDGGQPKSGWERRAEREWDRRRGIYQRYREVIGPLLPAEVRRLACQTLHDGVIRDARRTAGGLELLVDAGNALGGFRGRQVRLTFAGLKGRPAVARLPGAWWLYEEAHLSARARFALHVLFARGELVVEADELTIELLPR